MSKPKRGSIGEALARMQQLRERPEARTPEPVAEEAPALEAKPSPAGKRRITVYVSADLYAQARAAILELGAEGEEPASISALLDGALERELQRLARKHHGGEPWSPHRGRLPGGRPPSS